MHHSTSIITTDKLQDELFIEFDNYKLSEELRINKLLKDYKIVSIEYAQQTFTKQFKKKLK